MFTPAKLAVLLSAAFSVAAMPPHVVRNSNYHREIAARVAQPEVAPVVEIVARDVPVPAKRVVRRKRGDTERCKEHGGSDAPSSTPKEDPNPTSTSSDEPAATPKEDVTLVSTPPQNEVNNPKEDPKPTTSTPTPAPASTPASTPSTAIGGDTHTGQGTFYDIGQGACGDTNYEPDLVAAVAHGFFDQFDVDGNPNHNRLCRKTAEVTYQSSAPIQVKLVDRCGGCTGFDLDFSKEAFNLLTNNRSGLGRISGVTWRIID